jgi:hypothetical protein
MSTSARVVTTDKPYGEWDFPLPIGSDYHLNIIWQDEEGGGTDLDGYYAEVELRFNGQPVLNLNTDDGDVTIVTDETDASTIQVHFPNDKTRALVLAPHQYFVRVVAPGGNKTTILAGNANLIPS